MRNFKQKVLKIVSKIPRGKVLTYGQVARRAGNPKATRAVGQIMAANPSTRVLKQNKIRYRIKTPHGAGLRANPKIPCHRVIGRGGKLTGYSRKGGIKRKLKLLRREGVKMKFKI